MGGWSRQHLKDLAPKVDDGFWTFGGRSDFVFLATTRVSSASLWYFSTKCWTASIYAKLIHRLKPHAILLLYVPIPYLNILPCSAHILITLSPGAMLNQHLPADQTPSIKGSVMLATAASSEEVMEQLRKDVYAKGVWDLEKVEIIPVSGYIFEGEGLW